MNIHPSNILRKLRWRADFIFDPQKYLEKKILSTNIQDDTLRRTIQKDIEKTSLAERIFSITKPGSAPLSLDYWMKKRIATDPEGKLFFSTGKKKLFFDPDHPVHDKQKLIEGTLLVLSEAFIRPTEFFNEHVTIQPGDTILDLGAYIGTSAALFSHLTGPQGQVYSFEPIHSQALQKNIEINNLTNVECVPAAVGDENRHISFTQSDLGVSSRQANSNESKNFHTVPQITVDEFVAERGLKKVDFIKMDIEGAEEPALRGALKTLERFKPKLSIASYHTDISGDKQHPKLISLLKQLHYSVQELDHKHIYAWKN